MIGNEAVWARLQPDPGPLPILLRGIPHTGKRTGAREVMVGWGVDPVDVLSIDRLDVAGAEEFRGHFATRGVRGLRGAVACLDDSTPEGTGALLKTLEEPPEQARMVLTASLPVPLVVQSRCIQFRMRPLTPEEVRAVLTAQGRDPESVRLAGDGSIPPVEAVTSLEQAKGPVLQALKAASSGDENLFEASLQSFDQTSVAALQRFGFEAWTGRWRTFSPQEAFGLQQDRTTLRQIIAACVVGARPRVCARLALQWTLQSHLTA